jgi:glyoxylase-like metal-dependent hydrolase (beta-lactamase superfamily II)
MRTPTDGEAATETGVPQWRVGDMTVYRIDEVPLPAATGPWLLPEATAEVITRHAWLEPDFADRGVLRIDSHSFAFRTGGLSVVVDTGIGNGKPRANPAWHNLDSAYPQHLERVGFTPESVDLVILTHLHTDHVGWNTRWSESGGAWVPTFPRARYLTSRAEWDFWSDRAMDEPRQQMFRDSVYPVAEAGLLDPVDVTDGGAQIAPGVTLIPTPGHTPGHVAVRLRSADATALITGDCVHHPVQLARPGIGSCVDTDPAQATATRHALLASLADTNTLVLGTHFPPPTAGHVVRDGDAYRLQPVPASTPPRK